MRARVLAVAVVLTLVSSFTVTWAEQGDMRVRFGALFNIPTDDLEETGETLEADDAFGFQAGFEYQITDLIGIEPALGLATHDVEVTDAMVPDFVLGEIDFLALTTNLNFHVTPDKPYDFYLGPTIGFVMWGDLETDLFGPGGDVSADDEFTYGANVGVDVPFGAGKWAFSAAMTYLFAEVSLEGGTGDLGVNPFQLKAGASYKF